MQSVGSQLFESVTAVDWVVLSLAFTGGGLYKGLTGVGLPTIAVPILATVFPVSQALALVVIPILLSNVYQVFASRAEFRAALSHWPIPLFLATGLVIGVIALDTMDDDMVRILLGCMLLIFGLVSLAGLRPRVPVRLRRRLEPVIGFASGILGGITSIYGWPIVMYLLACETRRQEFVPTMALIYLTGHFVFMVALASLAILGRLEFLLSLIAIVPTFLGVYIGRRLLQKTSQATFGRLVDGVLLLGGLYMFATVIIW